MPTPRRSVDTHFFLRYLTGAPPEQAEQAERVLREAQAGKVRLVVPALVIAELIWALESSLFKLPKRAAAEKAVAVLSMDGNEVESVHLLEEAAVLHAELSIDFTDAFLACFSRAKGLEDVYTFDRRDYAKIGWLNVLP